MKRKAATPAARGGTPKARAPEAKQARAETLLKAAEDALLEGSYHDITMMDVARRAGLAKGTVYLYYPSKEALFMAVLSRKLDGCFDIIETELGTGRHSPDDVARVLTRALLQPHALLSLLSLLFSQLEPGAGIDALVEFKRYLTERMTRIGQIIEQAAGLSAGMGTKVLQRGNAMAIGLQQFASAPTDVMDQVYERAPELRHDPMDVEAELTDSIADIIRAKTAKV